MTLKEGLVSKVKIVQEPEISLYPVKPNKKVIISLAGVVGFFFFLFLAFFIEHIKNASKEE